MQFLSLVMYFLPHHGPRNIPITVELVGEYNYVHFPIVRTGRYAIYLDTPDVFDGLIYSGTNQNTKTGTEISTEPIIEELKDCKQFAQGVVSERIIFTQNDPQPVAIRLKGKAGYTIRYIVSLLEE